LFGEGLINDTVSIILYKAIFDSLDENDNIHFENKTPVIIFSKFIENFIVAIVIGVLFGITCCWTIKYCRFVVQLHHSAVLENCIIFLFGYMSYLICEIYDFSGIISILICGIIMAHYVFYNISSTGKLATGVIFETISYLSEGFIYSYIGFTAVYVIYNDKISWTFIICETFLMIFGRLFTIMFLSYFMYCVMKKKFKTNIWEIMIIWYSGLIRGSIAFALV